jgi:hypothetical protein
MSLDCTGNDNSNDAIDTDITAWGTAKPAFTMAIRHYTTLATASRVCFGCTIGDKAVVNNIASLITGRGAVAYNASTSSVGNRYNSDSYQWVLTGASRQNKWSSSVLTANSGWTSVIIYNTIDGETEQASSADDWSAYGADWTSVTQISVGGDRTGTDYDADHYLADFGLWSSVLSSGDRASYMAYTKAEDISTGTLLSACTLESDLTDAKSLTWNNGQSTPFSTSINPPWPSAGITIEVPTGPRRRGHGY